MAQLVHESEWSKAALVAWVRQLADTLEAEGTTIFEAAAGTTALKARDMGKFGGHWIIEITTGQMVANLNVVYRPEATPSLEEAQTA